MTSISSEDALREVYDPPQSIVVRKTLDELDAHCIRFIARSPFLCLATSDRDGRCDVSPRGDPPGFVRVVDRKTLLIPDRKGNNRLDSMSNLLQSPGIGLIFMVPGIEETLRVNGRGAIVDDPEVLQTLAVEGSVPKSAVRVGVEEAFIHCARAFRRSRLWDPSTHAERSEIPTIGQWLRDQVDPGEAEQELIDRGVAQEELEARRPEELY